MLTADKKKLLRALLVLPFNVLVTIPALILIFSKTPFRLSVSGLLVLGSLFFIIGLSLAVSTVRLFIGFGQGTPAPWSPPQKLVLSGPYRYVRNPMIIGVCLMLLGEVCFFLNNGLAVWLLIFVMINLIYIPLVEEKGLSKRFGEDYSAYKRQVPRWIPLKKPGV